ncbi:MAG: hypothetical protein SH817_01245 [Leptospira sp.]|nr:hypothetical protein [Leptospira sp.]
MSGFKKPLPLTIFPTDTNDSKKSWKAYFEIMEPSQMKIRLESFSSAPDFGSDILVVFYDATHRFQFDSAILSENHNGFINIRKPKVIYKRSL